MEACLKCPSHRVPSYPMEAWGKPWLKGKMLGSLGKGMGKAMHTMEGGYGLLEKGRVAC